MPEELLIETFEKVRRHPWWQARAQLALAILKQQGIHPPAHVLDAGCGWGTNLVALAGAGYHVDGLDVSRRVLELIDGPDRRLIEADLTRDLPPLEPLYAAALALDVIEHVDDDRGLVQRLAGLVQPGGIVLISVPALPELYSDFDRIQGHRRRYLPDTLRRAFEGTSLKVSRILWWGTWMVPVLRRMRRKEKIEAISRKTYADYLRVPAWPVSTLMKLLYRWEEPRALGARLRTGTSLLAIARRE